MSKLSARLKFGQKVKSLRKGSAWTQGNLAIRAGISKSYVQKIEGRNPPNMTIDTIKKIAGAFNREISALFI